MKKYFLHDGTNQHGPFDIEELKAKAITAQTLVWCEPMPEWKRADEVAELRVLFNKDLIGSQTTTTQPLDFNEQIVRQLFQTNHRLTTVVNLLIGILIATGIVALFIIIVVVKLSSYTGG